MPLLISPIDGSPMRQVNRFGIELDICPTSGGVWLDKGEVEKLLDVIRQETLRQSQEQMPERQYPFRGDDDDDYRRGPRKRSRLLDIFDF